MTSNDAVLERRTDRRQRRSMAPISRSGRKLSCDMLRVGKPEMEETAVVGELLKVLATEQGLQGRWGQPDLAAPCD